MTRTTIVVAALTSTVVLGGCARELEEDFAAGVAQSALETPENQQAAREITDIVDKDDCQLSAEEAAQEAAQRPSVGLYDSSCVTKTADGANMHVQFDDCTGPFGRVHLNGGMDATFSVDPQSCHVLADIVDDGTFTANDQPFDYDADADIEVLDGAREIDWNAHWAGKTRRDRDIEQTSKLDIHLDDPTSCVTVRSGDAEGTVGTYDYGWNMTDLSVCPDECPASGTVQAYWKGYARERTVTVEFDGSAVAHVTGWSGREFDVDLVCTPAK